MRGTPCERSWEISHRKLSYNYPVFCKYPGMTFCTKVRTADVSIIRAKTGTFSIETLDVHLAP
jgi:hypothetical protein